MTYKFDIKYVNVNFVFDVLNNDGYKITTVEAADEFEAAKKFFEKYDKDVYEIEAILLNKEEKIK